ncbi:Rubredoxin-type Fe(Cys)4 protein [Desulfofarcimen acetoxidans DSM 771]|uniref:Rubredoxin-type Fe(Cys)4 protein n=1 Tax=Desulfofarcimen acetoxidans (strain ATCC 49208 / DSM 771 / KCTC 5769 / VKM B-1644 / 5575) TaxID=485916 RepID=C8VW72_DESAS|nr:rubredoxin [Desulfofarcimen acetoxidans]ACV62424.1 Rubredoxin-type Fe(Cys)4 protein [Desulfofarcimen acetoxidans DSM 771]
MKKWKCSICGYIYDPEKESLPGETTGASKCDYVDDEGELVDSFKCKQCGAMKEAIKSIGE